MDSTAKVFLQTQLRYAANIVKLWNYIGLWYLTKITIYWYITTLLICYLAVIEYTQSYGLNCDQIMAITIHHIFHCIYIENKFSCGLQVTNHRGNHVIILHCSKVITIIGKIIRSHDKQLPRAGTPPFSHLLGEGCMKALQYLLVLKATSCVCHPEFSLRPCVTPSLQ
jgi:hypothetical protein